MRLPPRRPRRVRVHLCEAWTPERGLRKPPRPAPFPAARLDGLTARRGAPAHWRDTSGVRPPRVGRGIASARLVVSGSSARIAWCCVRKTRPVRWCRKSLFFSSLSMTGPLHLGEVECDVGGLEAVHGELEGSRGAEASMAFTAVHWRITWRTSGRAATSVWITSSMARAFREVEALVDAQGEDARARHDVVALHVAVVLCSRHLAHHGDVAGATCATGGSAMDRPTPATTPASNADDERDGDGRGPSPRSRSSTRPTPASGRRGPRGRGRPRMMVAASTAMGRW